jgi:hypothetical protein
VRWVKLDEGQQHTDVGKEELHTQLPLV